MQKGRIGISAMCTHCLGYDGEESIYVSKAIIDQA